MTTLILLAILGTLLGVVLMQLFRKPSAPAPAAGPDLANLKAADARTGDVISVSGAGDNMSDLDFTADRSMRYEAGARRWFEVSGPYRERRVALRVAGDEDAEISIHIDPRQLSLEDLGINEEDVAQMDERQNTADSFEFDNKVWLYRVSREAKAWRDDRAQPAQFYYWEFREQDGKGLLAIRKAEGEPFTVSLYTGIPAGDVTVYRGGNR
ncbi:MAG: hypothetical protein C5B51_05765 [Terriglobia bacterium]|nr:MAG: hypothetical protein C5B51_05765 [Terriglobia bacterium]